MYNWLALKVDIRSVTRELIHLWSYYMGPMNLVYISLLVLDCKILVAMFHYLNLTIWKIHAKCQENKEKYN